MEEAIKSYENEKFPWTKKHLINELEKLIEIIKLGYFDYNPIEVSEND